MTALRKSFIAPVGAQGLSSPSLTMTDCSLSARSGFKGAGTPEWLQHQGLNLPANPNQALEDGQGRLIARLSWGEFLLLGDFASLDQAWSFESAPLCFPVPRQHSHAWIALTGEAAPKMMAKVCGIDLRPHKFPVGAIAQTSVARLSAIVIAARIGAKSGFHLLSDVSTSQYLWDCLADAMLEFDEAP